MGAIHSIQYSNNNDDGGVKQQQRHPISHSIIQSLATFSDHQNKQIHRSSRSNHSTTSSHSSPITAKSHGDIYHALRAGSKLTTYSSARLRPFYAATRQQSRRYQKSNSRTTTPTTEKNHSSLRRSHPSVTNALSSKTDADTTTFTKVTSRSSKKAQQQHIRTHYDRPSSSTTANNPYKSITYLQKRYESSKKIPVERSGSKYDHAHVNNSINSTLTSATSIMDEKEEEEMHYLQRMYDLRTWDMYLRITEARKRKKKHITAVVSPSTHNNIANQYNSTNTGNLASNYQVNGIQQTQGIGVMVPVISNNDLVLLLPQQQQQNIYCHQPLYNINMNKYNVINNNDGSSIDHELIFGDIE